MYVPPTFQGAEYVSHVIWEMV